MGPFKTHGKSLCFCLSPVGIPLAATAPRKRTLLYFLKPYYSSETLIKPCENEHFHGKVPARGASFMARSARHHQRWRMGNVENHREPYGLLFSRVLGGWGPTKQILGWLGSDRCHVYIYIYIYIYIIFNISSITSPNQVRVGHDLLTYLCGAVCYP